MTPVLDGKKLFIRFAVRVFVKVNQFLCASFLPLGFEGGMWELIVLILDHCISIYFKSFIITTPGDGPTREEV